MLTHVIMSTMYQENFYQLWVKALPKKIAMSTSGKTIYICFYKLSLVINLFLLWFLLAFANKLKKRKCLHPNYYKIEFLEIFCISKCLRAIFHKNLQKKSILKHEVSDFFEILTRASYSYTETLLKISASKSKWFLRYGLLKFQFF